MPPNAFAREILHRLGIGINQLNPNAWRLIICKYYGGNFLMGTVLSLWMNSYTIISPQKLVSP